MDTQELVIFITKHIDYMSKSDRNFFRKVLETINDDYKSLVYSKLYHRIIFSNNELKRSSILAMLEEIIFEISEKMMSKYFFDVKDNFITNHDHRSLKQWYSIHLVIKRDECNKLLLKHLQERIFNAD